MDFIARVKRRTTTVCACSEKAERWLRRNLFFGHELTIPSDRVPMVCRAVREDRLDIVVDGDGRDRIVRDFDDQYSALLIAKAIRMTGRSHEALVRLIGLRCDVLLTVDPKGALLLPDIDREIALAHGLCRLDKHSNL